MIPGGTAVGETSPDHLTRAESEAVTRRRRGRNLALLVGLLALAAIFYAVAMVKLAQPAAH